MSALGVVLEVPGAHQGEGIEAVQMMATGRADVEQGFGVEHRVGEIDVYAAEGIHAVYKTVEIELNEMVDRDARDPPGSR